jgi:hypothetical protein
VPAIERVERLVLREQRRVGAAARARALGEAKRLERRGRGRRRLALGGLASALGVGDDLAALFLDELFELLTRLLQLPLAAQPLLLRRGQAALVFARLIPRWSPLALVRAIREQRLDLPLRAPGGAASCLYRSGVRIGASRVLGFVFTVVPHAFGSLLAPFLMENNSLPRAFHANACDRPNIEAGQRRSDMPCDQQHEQPEPSS